MQNDSAILLTFIKLPIAIEIFVLSTFAWPFTQVLLYSNHHAYKEQEDCLNSLVVYVYVFLPHGAVGCATFKFDQ